MANEYLDFGFEIKQASQDDPDFFFIEGLASTFGNVDSTGDVIRRGAFTETLEKLTPKILWMHRASEPIGMPVSLVETMEGLEIKLKLPKDDSFVRDRVMPQVKIGSISAMSIGFRIMDRDDIEFDDDVRIIKRVTLHEISLVPFPANELAQVSGFKSDETTKHSYPDVKKLDKRAIEKVLSDSGLFSSKAATYIASQMPSDSVQEPSEVEKALAALKAKADNVLIQHALTKALR